MGGAPGFRVRSFRFVDPSRTIRLPDGRRVPRPLETLVRYPAAGTQHPLIIFAHGFALTPATYGRLLTVWTQAGYVVAAPVFPLENANAPGGPTQSDLVNEPQDVSFVITKLLALDARPNGVLAGRIDPSQIAVAGHSDGAVAALAVAYDRRFRDPRLRAAIVMSGAALPGMGPFPVRGPPLLAVQGTADPLNAPATTAAYFLRAHRPKFLLWLLGASPGRPTHFRNPSSGLSNGLRSPFSTTTCEVGRCRPSTKPRNTPGSPDSPRTRNSEPEPGLARRYEVPLARIEASRSS